jgi:hypothetical protein
MLYVPVPSYAVCSLSVELEGLVDKALNEGKDGSFEWRNLPVKNIT